MTAPQVMLRLGVVVATCLAHCILLLSVPALHVITFLFWFAQSPALIDGTRWNQPPEEGPEPLVRLTLRPRFLDKQNKQKFKVRQPQRAARSKRPNTLQQGKRYTASHNMHSTCPVL